MVLTSLIFSHPGKLPLNRLNFETGKAEYRCGACTDYRVKWYTADALLSHEFYKYVAAPPFKIFAR